MMRVFILAAIVAVFLPLQVNAQFPSDGGFRIGCNYWASHAGVKMWSRWNAAQVEKDLDALADNGISVLRIFPLWPDFQPLTARYEWAGTFREWAQNDGPLNNPACVDDEMMRRFRDFCRMAERRNMKLVVGLLTGWMSGRLFAPPALERLNLVTDPTARMWEVRFVRHFVRETKDCAAIAAWDLGNECNCLGKTDSRSEAWSWLYEISSAIRLEDSSRPVVGGMHSLASSPNATWNLRDQGELVDVLTTHPYPLWTPDMNYEPLNSLRNGLHASAESLFYAGVSGRPCFPEEAGDMGRNVCSETRAAGNVRNALFTSWANGLGAFVWWCAFDYGHLDFPPYTWTAVECDLGLLGKDYREKPVLKEMHDFSMFLKTFPHAKLPKRRIDAVCLASERGAAFPQSFGAFALSRQAGFDIEFVGAEGGLPESGFYIMPSGEGYDAYSVDAWRRVLSNVNGGATLLVTKGDRMALANFREATGNELDYSAKDAPSELNFELAAFPGRAIRVKRSSTIRVLPRESKSIGVEKNGDAMVTIANYGKGRVMVVNAAIERESFLGTGAYFGEGINPLYLVYREAAKIAGVKRIVEKSEFCPNVGLTEHKAPDGAIVVVAVNYNPVEIACPVKINGNLGRVWRGDVSPDCIRLGPNDVAVFEVLFNASVSFRAGAERGATNPPR